MSIFTRKKEKIVKDYLTEQVDGAEVFVVSWDTFKRLYSDTDIMRRHRKAKAFLKEEDAETFKKSLYDSLILLQFAKDKEEAQFILQLKIEKQS